MTYDTLHFWSLGALGMWQTRDLGGIEQTITKLPSSQLRAKNLDIYIIEEKV